MSDRKRRKNKHEIKVEEPTKVELQIAKHVRFKTPKKSTVMNKEAVDYFVGSKAVDTLMSSKWAKSNKKQDPIFTCREDAVVFMEKLLMSKMFYRVKKELKQSKDGKAIKENADEDTGKSKARKRKEKGKEAKASEKEVEKAEEDDDAEKKSDTKEGGDKKKKRRYKLEVHEEQVFLDSNEGYIWIYDPVHPRTWFLGGVILLGVIAATLFPIWPPFVRVGVYYLSIVGGVFIGSIFAIAMGIYFAITRMSDVCAKFQVRSCVFAIIWVVTLGRHHCWFLPNLLADVGFFESFKPVYTHDYYPPGEKKKADGKKGGKKSTPAVEATTDGGAGDGLANSNVETGDDDDGDGEKEAASGEDIAHVENADGGDQISRPSSDQCSDDESEDDAAVTNTEEQSSSDYEVINTKESQSAT